MIKNDIVTALTKYGYLDIARANEVMNAANVTDSDVAEYIKEIYQDNISKADVVASVFYFILNKVKADIEKLTGKDIEDKIQVAGNYCATTFDFKDEEKDEVLALIKTIEEPSDTLKWFTDQIV